MALRRVAGALAVCVAGAGLLAACTSGDPTTLRLHVSPARALFDAPVTVTVSGAQPGGRVTLATSARARDGTVWTSSATFVASTSGAVSTAQAPVSGSYRGANAMGLFEDVAPGGDPGTAATFYPAAGGHITVTAEAAGGSRSVTITRLFPSQVGVRSQALRPATSGGLYGQYYRPRSTAGRHPAMIVVGGSEGGLSTTLAADVLAAHGYPALALAYFHEPGLPQTLRDVPIEYFGRAFTWLARQRGVDPHRMAIWGTSRGSEAALLTGAHYPTLVAGVVASVPSDIAYGDFPSSGDPAWTFGGRAVPTAQNGDFTVAVPQNRAALIPITRIRGPIFAVCAGQDGVWPSCVHATSIATRLAAAHSRYRATVLRYPDAGHFVGGLLPYLPSTDLVSSSGRDTGGTPQANQAGRADAYPKLLHWLASLPALS